MNTIATRRNTFADGFRRGAVAAVAIVGMLFATTTFAQPVTQEPTHEEVSAFAADVTVNADGTIGVIEKIDYAFPTPKHGIYRELPLDYRTDAGERFRIPITVTSVSQDGEPAEYSIENGASGIRIKIGDPGKTISGFHSYVIAYSASGALRYFSDHDEVYWNVTGTGWQVPIAKSSATIHGPPSVSGSELTLKCFSGAAGSTAEDCLKNVQGDKAYFAANGPLTVVVGWPPGRVAKLLPIRSSVVAKFFSDFPWDVLLLVVPIGLFAYLLVQWMRHGRDARGSRTLVVQYDPPPAPAENTGGRKSLTPAETGAMVDGTVNTRDIVATLVDLAVRGYVTISETEQPGLLGFGSSKDYVVAKKKEFGGDPGLLPYERQTLDVLLGASPQVSMSSLKQDHSFYERIPAITSDINNRLTSFGFYSVEPSKARGKYVLAAGVAGFVMYIAFRVESGWLFASAAASCGLLVLFSFLMVQRTPAGAAALDHAKGFKEYLEKAEKYRIQWQESENVFEKFLPYAMAFGVVEKWSKAFAGITLPPPQWYQGSAMSAGVFNVAAFSAAMRGFDHAASASFQSAPQRSGGGSGFSGGGFSGGGGGGGGGGSW